MQENNTFKLALKSKIFSIPSDSRFLLDISPSIYTTLITQKLYEVQSNVSVDIFEQFIGFLVSRQIPALSPKNIFDYDLLSHEFDLMKDLVQLYKNKINMVNKFKNKNQELRKIHDTKSKEIDQKTINYQQIIHHLLKDIKIDTYYKYIEVRRELYEACKTDSVKLVSLLTQKTIKFNNDFIFVLDDEKMTANILHTMSKCNSIHRSIEYKTKKYLVTGIYENAMKESDMDSPVHISKSSELKFIEKSAFSHATIKRILIPPNVSRIEENTFSFCTKLQKVEFHSNSKLKFIGKKAFFNSSIKSLFIPSCVLEFDDGWCSGTKNLINILINPSDEQNIMYYDNKFIIGKSDKKSDIFDVLYFARRNIKEAKIPPFIRTIAPYAFENYIELQEVEFIGESQLTKIGRFAFSKTSIKKLTIPSSVVEFQLGWCSSCSFLTDIKITPNLIKNIMFYDKFIVKKSDQNIDIFDTILCACRDIETAKIPSFIKQIDPFAFENCCKLNKVEFDQNSELFSIGQNAFCNTSITNISIPSSVYSIGKSSFSFCSKLKSFEISNKNEFCKIERLAFYGSLLTSLTIPSNGIMFSKEWCFGILYLNHIIITPSKKQEITFYDNKFIVAKSSPTSEDFDTLIFARRDINDTITIPKFIKQIHPYAFEFVKSKNIQFADNSLIKKIDKLSFANSFFENITIPSSVTEIDQNAFFSTKNIKNFQFENNSQLHSINLNAFNSSILTSIKIPSSVKKIDQFSFYRCKNLSEIEFEPNSKLNSIEKAAFCESFIKKITIPSSATRIEQFAFYGCLNLQEVYFEPNSKLMIINESAFAYSNIKEIEVPSNVVYLESNAFLGCEKLEIVKFIQNSSLKKIGSYAFAKTSINEISIPSQVVLIDDFAFYECTKLQNVCIPKDSELKYIGIESFVNTSISHFFLPKKVTQIDDYSFSSCQNLTTFECDEDSELKIIGRDAFTESSIKKLTLPSGVSEFGEDWCSIFQTLSEIKIIPTKEKNIIYYKNEYLLSKTDPKSDVYDVLVFANRAIYRAYIPSFIKKIGNCAFSNCKMLYEVIFPENSQLLEIEKSAFYNSSIEYISFPKHLVSIGKDTFSECSLLEDVDFSKSIDLKKIGKFAFHGSIIKSISLPSNVELKDGIFYSVSTLTDIEIIPNGKQNISLYKNCFLISKSDSKSDIFDVLVYIKQNIVDAIIPSFIKKIASHAFPGCKKLKSLNFEENSELNLIDDFAFCFSNIFEIIIPKKVTKIGDSAFNFCKKLKIVEFEDDSSLQFIDDFAFSDSALISFSIPKKVKKLGFSVFASCKNLQIVEIDEESQLRSLNSCMLKSTNAILMIPSKLNGNLLLNT